MATVTRSIAIQCDVDAISSYLADVTHDADWRSAIESVELKTGERGALGSTYEVVATPMGMKMNLVAKVTELEPGALVGVVATGMGPTAHTTYRLEPVADGTKLTMTAKLDAGAMGKMLGPIIGKENAASLKQLKLILESAR